MRKAWSASIVVLALAGCDVTSQSGSGQQQQQTKETAQAPAIAPDALRTAAGQDKEVAQFYAARNWQPIWTDQRRAALLAALKDAPANGLVTTSFLEPEAVNGQGAAREIALTRAALSYAKALAVGATDPKVVADVYTLPRPAFDPGKALGQALQQGGDLHQWFASLPPQTDEYRALSQAYLSLSRRAQQTQRANIAAGATIHPGGHDSRMPAIAQALAAQGYLAPQLAQQATTAYAPPVEDAIKHLEQDHGMKPDGVIGKSTLDALNEDVGDRARRVAINMERLRWLERTPPATRIDVNTAATQLYYWRDGKLVDTRKVIAGQPGWETPRLEAPMFRLVANPTWTVPKSIVAEELAGKGEAYLQRNNMIHKDGQIVQQPGPKNSLGLVKFDMEDPYAIYLHDTPAKPVFARDDRHDSHGCVRVEDAIGFARMIADQEGKRADFEQGLASGNETFVPLPTKIPVRLMYRTVYTEPNGQLRFVADDYGWDGALYTAMKLGTEQARAKHTHEHSLAP